jgi:ATP-dependent DNA helicase RecG
MRTTKDIERLLDRLDNVIADELESQDLDFKQWDTKSRRHAVAVAIEMAVCMANGGGGTVVFGVSDRVTGRRQAISGVPYEIDVARLQRSIYDSTDPKITPVVDELQVPEGTGRLLVMHVYPGLPPYTDVQGRAKIRVGKECLPLTGTLRRKIAVETGEGDYTRELVAGSPQEHLSASALEELRAIARWEHAPADLVALSDVDLLELLGLAATLS